MQRVLRSSKMVGPRGLGAAFRDGATGSDDLYGVAFHGTITPGIALSVVIEVDLEGTVGLHRPYSSKRVGPSARERRRACCRRGGAGLKQKHRHASENNPGE